jgi:hypothetical protein
MTSVTGRVEGAGDARGLSVVATYATPLDVGGDQGAPTTAIGRRLTEVAPGGAFALELPDPPDRQPPTAFVVVAPSGTVLTVSIVEDDAQLADPVVLEVTDVPEPLSVEPSTDPALGRRVTYSMRIIDPAGQVAPAGLLVVLWGIPPGGGDDDATPLDVATTTAGGYAFGLWPSDELDRAYAVVAGGDPVEIVLNAQRLPTRFAIVVPELPEPPAHDEDGCACDVPPRAPDATQLADDPEAFAADPGGCVDFTIPNRTLEEVTYQAVVRTTQPELRGTPRSRPTAIPKPVIDRLVALTRSDVTGPVTSESVRRAARLRPRLPRLDANAVGDLLGDQRLAETATSKAENLLGGVDIDRDMPPSAVAEAIVEHRDFTAAPLQLERSALAELARELSPLTPLRLVNAELSSKVRRFRGDVEQLAGPNPARFSLDDTHQVDWDDLPLPYQATTIAHGHLLTFKQVWKADGYSLGDLLYSLPLAPGQQKLVSILDWERRETARRDARRTETEDVVASLTHDRDVSDIITSTLREHLDGRSSADVSAVGGALGAFIGPLVIGAAGGVSSASSTADQTSGRDVAGSALNQVRDRTMQAASAVRSQRATVVESARQGESVQATTEVLVNYNHCHSMTVEYFEVLRHLQVSQELHMAEECLFVPMAITPFSQSKALRWRDQLEPRVRRPALRGTFAALDRVARGWADSDTPFGRYADEAVVDISGDLTLRMSLPRPRDTGSNLFDAGAWTGYAPWLAATPKEVFDRYLGPAAPAQRDAIWNRAVAPGIAQRIVNGIGVELVPADGSAPRGLSVDPSLVSQFAQDRPLTVGLRIEPASIAGMKRAQIRGVRITAPGGAPGQARMTVDFASFRYRTAHLAHPLVAGARVTNDLAVGDPVEVLAPLDRLERRNPRDHDRRLAVELLEHLDANIEHYHRAIWIDMDPNRRYLLLDGFVAPDAGGRSVASVVVNRIAGIVGNCLVMPLRPGAQLDPTYAFADATLDDLRHLYAGGSAPPMRIGMPTRGVFAEAVLGHCNSCEEIDDSRFWRFEEEPIPDTPTAIQSLSTDSRRSAAPDLSPDLFPSPVVRMQQAPAAPDPTGLAAAMRTLGTAGLFKNITGLALNQANSAQALKTAISTAQTFATQAGALAQQRYMTKELDRGLDRIKDARDQGMITPEQARTLSESAFRGALGEPRPKTGTATASPGVSDVIKRVADAKTSGSFRLTRPEGTLEVKTGGQVGKADKISVAASPDVDIVVQKTNMVCWAAAGTMMRNWKRKEKHTVEATLDALGGPWRARYDANNGLTAQQLQDFTAALGLSVEGPMSYAVEGLESLMAAHGPLWAITDDAYGDGNQVVHARLVVAMRGDGTPDGTLVTIADPGFAVPQAESFATFSTRLEATEAVAIGTGIFHW